MIAVSSLNFKNNKEKMLELDNLGADYIHMDIMDGEFVKQVAGMELLDSYQTKREVHLMVKDIKKYIDIYQKYKPEYITFHVEATNQVEYFIDYIHSLGIKAGITINPHTPVDSILPYLPKVDHVLVMTVEAGLGGQSFMPEMVPKVEQLYNLRNQYHYHYVIEVDGGINLNTKDQVSKADIWVVGSYITSSENMKEKLESLRGTLA